MPRSIAVTFAEQVEELDREIKMRKSLYPKWISEGRVKPDDAEKKLARLTAARETFAALDQYKAAVPRAFFSLRTVEVDL